MRSSQLTGGWDAFFDYPPRNPAGTVHSQGAFRLRGATIRTIGERVELLFDGLSMGAFEGGIAYTIYPGSRLIQQEAVVTTNQPLEEIRQMSDGRIYSRLSEMCRFVSLQGVDYREHLNPW